MKNIHKISICAALCSLGLVAHAQTIIDPLNGTGGITYTNYLTLDQSQAGAVGGVADGVSFTQSGSGLQDNYTGSTAHAEQAMSLAPGTSFGTTFAVGDTLSVASTVASSGVLEDFGLAITAGPATVASAGNSWDSRATFDFMTISIRPSTANNPVASIKVTTSVSGSVVANGPIGGGYTANPSVASITGLYIDWLSTTGAGENFAYGYLTAGSIENQVGTITYAPGSTIGNDIGFYGDLRATGTSIGNFQNLSITAVPEPSTLAMCGVGFVGLLLALRRKQYIS